MHHNCFYISSAKWNGTSIKITSDADLPDDQKVMLCAKITGILDKKPVVARECVRAPGMFNGTCTSDIKFRIDGMNVNDALACMCDGDKCNGALRFHLTYILLFATFCISLYQTYS